MAAFVMIHGSFHGGWCWKKLLPYLRADGHEVYAPTLTGLGERAHLASPDTDLETHIADVLGVFRFEELDNVFLCAHSYGGMVARGVADRIPHQIAALIYIDALVPLDGQSVMDLIEERYVELYRASARDEGDGWRVSPVPADAYGVIEPADAAWVDRLCVPHPIASYEQPIKLSGEDDGVERHIYIRARQFEEVRMDAFALAAQRDPSWQVVTLDAGHDLMISTPFELAQVLLTAI